MGNGESDNYQLYDIKILQKKDALPIRYYWIDSKFNNSENQVYLDKFKEKFNVGGYTSVNDILNEIKAKDIKKERIKAICSASLAEEDYKYIQNQNKIETALLFCANRIRASNLRKDYSKIRKVCYSYGQVIKAVEQLARDDDQTLIFFSDEEIPHYNQIRSSHLSLLHSKSINGSKSRADFVAFLKRLRNPKQSSRIDEIIMKMEQAKKADRQNYILEFALQNNFVINEINDLLKGSKNPTKLAYLRYCLSFLCPTIEQFYKKANFKSNTFYTIITLNDFEQKTLLKNNCFSYNGLLLASDINEGNELLQDQLMVEIKVPNKAQGYECPGYCLKNGSIIFNIGNFFKVQTYQPSTKQLCITLLTFNKEIQIKKDQIKGTIILNKLYLENQQDIYEGQWNSLLLNKYDCQKYCEALTSQYAKETKDQSKVISFLLKQIKRKMKDGAPLAELNSQLESIIQNYRLNYGNNAEKFNVLLVMLELYLRRESDSNFQVAMDRFNRWLDVANPTCFTEQNKIKLQIFKQAKKLKESTQINQIQKVIEALDKIENALIKNPKALVEDCYQLQLLVKMKCNESLKRYKQKIQIIDRFLWLQAACSGRNTQFYDKMNKLKYEAIKKNNEQQSIQESAKKKKRYTSQVSMEQLLKNDQQLILEKAGLDMTLFN